MSRHIVCLSFDFDAMSGFIARGMTTPTPISRGEFGALGARRILDLLKSRDITASWFIPGVTIGTYPEICERIASAGHEVGHHGWTHVPPAEMSRQQEHDGLVRANEAIEALSGRKARGYRSPSWDLSAHTVELLIAEGFVYDSSMMGHDYLPYRARNGDVVTLEEAVELGAETALIEMPVSWSLDDYPHFEYVRHPTGTLPGLKAGSAVLENWVADYRYMVREYEWGVVTYTFHPLVTGRGHRMLVLEGLMDTLAREGAEFMTVEAAAGEFAARGG